MFIAIIVLALIVGAWAGIMFDLWTLDTLYDGETSEPFSYYAQEPVNTLRRFWEILGK